VSLYKELKRRNVFRVSVAYVAISWVLLQAVDVILNNIEAPVWIFQTILLVLVIGFIPTVSFSWAFELTPEGLKRDSKVDHSRSVSGQPGRKLTLVIIVCLMLGLGYFLFNQLIEVAPQPAGQAADSAAVQEQPAGASPPPNSIAVLPFTNMSGDPGTEPFALGIHDDLLTHLSRIKALKTTSRTSVLQYGDTTKSIPQIAGELSVTNILEGSIQRSGDRVRINLQLIDAASDAHVWAEIYDRELTAENLFAVQADVATQVARALQATLLPEEQSALARTPTQSMAAYDLYLLGRYHWNMQTAESAEQALQYFTEAIEEDPNYVPALSGLADSYVSLVQYGNLTGPEAFPRALELLDQAMAQDDAVSEVWASLGQLRFYQGELPAGREALERALELDPQNFWAWYRYGNVLAELRQFEHALEAYETAYLIEPMSRPINETLGFAYQERGQFARSRRHFERVDQIQDKDPTEWKERIGYNYLEAGELARAVIEAHDILAIDPNNLDAMGLLVKAYRRLGDLDEAEVWARRAERLNTWSSLPVMVLEARADYEGAIIFLEDLMLRLGERHNRTLFWALSLAYRGQMPESAASYAKEFLAILDESPPLDPNDARPTDYLFGLEYMINGGYEDLEFSAEEAAIRVERLEEVAASVEYMSSQGYQHPETFYALAMARTLLGNHDGAFQALDEAVTRGYAYPWRIATEFSLDPLRTDPRFAGIESRVNQHVDRQRERLADAQLADYQPAGKRPVVILPRATLENYAGHYTDGNMVLRFYFDDKDRFTINLAQQYTPSTLVAASEDTFYIPAMSADSFRFAVDESGTVSHVFWESGGRANRFKAVPPPPAEVQLDRATLERYVGTYVGRVQSNDSGEASDFHTWIIRIYLDEAGEVWQDYPNQPDKFMKPFSETEFYIPGFMGRRTFVVDPATGRASKFIAHWDDRDVPFERQE
jgi:TolB-like protein/Tfp pilus assembly protein PilF